MTIKAIDTHYKGYRFRSRLEARWAVFFDALGMRWRYETEGFVLAEEYGGLCYLPDFYLPDWDLFIEVKPDLPRDDIWHEKPHGPTEKCEHGILLMTQGEKLTTTGKFIMAASELQTKDAKGVVKPRLVMACGSPYVPKLGWDGFWKLEDGAVVLSFMDVKGIGYPLLTIDAWSTSMEDDSLDIWPLYLGGNPVPNGEPGSYVLTAPVFPCSTMQRFYVGPGRSFDSTRLERAYRAARSARFDRAKKARTTK